LGNGHGVAQGLSEVRLVRNCGFRRRRSRAPSPGRGKVIDCNRPIDPKHADPISVLTDNLNIEIETYSDAAHAIRRWFATMREPGAALTACNVSERPCFAVNGIGGTMRVVIRGRVRQ
jgi:hypothetical protein